MNKVEDLNKKRFSLINPYLLKGYYPDPNPVTVERKFLRIKKSCKVRKLDNKFYVIEKLFHAVQHGYLLLLESTDRKLIERYINILDDKNKYSLLHYACLENHKDVVEFLLEYNPSLNLEGSKGIRPLHLAAQMNHYQIVELLCKQRGIKIDISDGKGQTPLLIACRRCYRESVQILLKYRANIKLLENDNISVLHHPVRRNNLELVQILMDAGAPLNIPNNNGQTPIMVAAIEGFVEIFNYYIERLKLDNPNIVDILSQEDNDGFNCLALAVQNRNSEIIKICQNYGVDIYNRQSDGKTIFHIAAAMGYKELFEILNENKKEINVNVTDNHLNTPLHLAVINSDLEMIKLLIGNKASTNMCNRYFFTALLLACKKTNTPSTLDIIKLLVENGNADITIRDYQLKTVYHHLVEQENIPALELLVKTIDASIVQEVINFQNDSFDSPLHVAARIGNLEIVKLLLNAGGNPLLYTDSDYSALHEATKYGHLDCVKLLLEVSDKSLSIRNADEVTPILLAARENKLEIFEYFIGIGKDPFTKDEFGRNALMFAARSGSTEIINILINMNVNINIIDQMKNTAMHEAAMMGHLEVVELLWNNGGELSENDLGHTQLDVALIGQNWNVVKFFINDDNWKVTMSYRHRNGNSHMKFLIIYNEQLTSELLDRCITENTRNIMDPNYEVKYSFNLLDAGPDDAESITKRNYPLKDMADYRKEYLLSHPLTAKYIQIKWFKFGLPIFIIDLLLYLTYLCCITGYIYVVEKVKSTDSTSISTGCTWNSSSVGTSTRGYVDWKVMMLNTMVYTITGLRLFIQLVKLVGQLHLFFLDPWNYVFTVTYSLVFCFIDKFDRQPCLKEWKYAPFLILLTWYNLIYYIQHLPSIGIVVVMFQRVMYSAIKVLLVFSSLAIGFAYAFYIVNDDIRAFSNVGYSYLKVMAMMIGELEIVTYFIDTTSKNYHEASAVLIGMFIVLLPITLLNLLVGLAVGDIEVIKREASIESIRIKIDYFYNVESNLFTAIQRKIYQSEQYERPIQKKKSTIVNQTNVTTNVNNQLLLINKQLIDIMDKLEQLKNDRISI